MPISNTFVRDYQPTNRTFGVVKRAKLHKILGLKEMQSKAENEVESVINDLQLNKLTSSRLETLPHTCNINADVNYKKNATGIRNFLALIGDCRSMTTTSENLTVSMCPSMNPTSIALCMDWKHGNKYECL